MLFQAGDEDLKHPPDHGSGRKAGPVEISTKSRVVIESATQIDATPTLDIQGTVTSSQTDGPGGGIASGVSNPGTTVGPYSSSNKLQLTTGELLSRPKNPTAFTTPVAPATTTKPATSTITPTVVAGSTGSSSGSGGISTGGIAAAVVVPIVVIGLALIFGLLWLRRRRRRTGHSRNRSSSFGRREKNRGASDGAFSTQEKIYMHGRDGAAVQKNNVDASVYQPVPNYSGSLDRQNVYPEPVARRNSRSPFRDPSPANSASNTPPEISQSFLDHMHHDNEDLGAAFARATGEPLTLQNMQEHEHRNVPTATATHDDDARSVVSSISSAGDFGDANVEDARSAHVARASIGRLERASVVGVSKQSTDQAPR